MPPSSPWRKSLRRVKITRISLTRLPLPMRTAWMRIQINPTRNSPGCFAGRLVHSENMGADVFLHMELDNRPDPFVARATPFEAEDIAVGDEVWVGREPGKAMAFGEDGRRLPLIGEQASEQVA